MYYTYYIILYINTYYVLVDPDCFTPGNLFGWSHSGGREVMSAVPEDAGDGLSPSPSSLLSLAHVCINIRF